MFRLFITVLFTPLGLTLLGMALLAALAWRRRFVGGLHGGVGAGLLLAPLLFLGFFSIPAVGQGLQNILVSQIKGRVLNEGEQVQAIIVLTGGMYEAGPVGYIPRTETVQRLAVGYELQRRLGLRVPVIISGGHTHGVLAPSEARVAAEFFARFRSEIVPTELEEISGNTIGSAEQLAPILARRAAQNVVLVTSDIHMPRALASYRAKGVDPIPAPAFMAPSGHAFKTYLPSAHGLSLSTAAFTELYSLLGALLAGDIRWADLVYKKS